MNVLELLRNLWVSGANRISKTKPCKMCAINVKPLIQVFVVKWVPSWKYIFIFNPIYCLFEAWCRYFCVNVWYKSKIQYNFVFVIRFSIPTESSKNFSINTRDWEGRIDNHLFLGHDKLEVMAHSLKIIDTRGAILFSADKNEVAIGAASLRVEGEGGVIFRESVQTPMIRAEPGHELK